MNNKKLGNTFESEFCQLLYLHGYWVHNFVQNQSGQPADVIAVKNGRPYLIDCKVCSGKGFALSRIEENQDLAMTHWRNCGNGDGQFAMRIDDDIYMVTHKEIKSCQKESSLLNIKRIKSVGVPLEYWIN